mmetsp:Transcript_33479/g.40558  ORF Transcript_33479/g.40558 Transcript_33479/m.40558 type:complete len:80 (-) Transcript_33479:225-464(-)
MIFLPQQHSSATGYKSLPRWNIQHKRLSFISCDLPLLSSIHMLSFTTPNITFPHHSQTFHAVYQQSTATQNLGHQIRHH